MSHLLSCPQRTSPYAPCKCDQIRALDASYEHTKALNENTEQMRNAAESDTRITELLAEIDRLKKDASGLNEMLRDRGYSQGEIDAYVTQCEEVDRLKAENERLRKIIGPLPEDRLSGDPVTSSPPTN